MKVVVTWEDREIGLFKVEFNGVWSFEVDEDNILSLFDTEQTVIAEFPSGSWENFTVHTIKYVEEA